jgi:hypothetical protein
MGKSQSVVGDLYMAAISWSEQSFDFNKHLVYKKHFTTICPKLAQQKLFTAKKVCIEEYDLKHPN